MDKKYILYSHKVHKFFGDILGLTEDIKKAYTYDCIGDAIKASTELDNELQFKAYPL